MKHFEKKMNGFCVTYLHNPFKCKKCLAELEYKDDYEETLITFYSRKREQPQPSPVNTDVPFFDLLFQPQTVFNENNFFMPLLLPSTSLSSFNFSKKKNPSDAHPENSQSTKFSRKINKMKKSPKPSKKVSVEKCEKITPVVKKQGRKAVQKISGVKIPGKGTLKRKRWFIKQLQQKNDNYEDDLFEDKKFGHFRSLLEEDESDNPENYTGVKTPDFPFSISPRRSTPSPDFRDCYSTEQLKISRKIGEEYQYRRKRQKKLDFSFEQSEEKTSPFQEKKSEQKRDSVLESLIKVEKILSSFVNEDEKSDTEDQYFSDILN